MLNKTHALILLSVIVLAASLMLPVLVSAKPEPEQLVVFELRVNGQLVPLAIPSTDDSMSNDDYLLLGFHWQTTANYYINTNNKFGFSAATVVSTITTSADTWDKETSKTVFFYKGTTARTTGKRDGYNVIGWGNYKAGVIAVAYLWYRGESMIESDLKMNTYYKWSTTGQAGRMDVQNIVTHEFGHWAGLDDLYSDADYWLTMYGYSDYGETYGRTLGLGDILGIQAAYGQ